MFFSGVEGVEAQSEKVWRQSNKYNVSKLAFINKLDRAGAFFDRVVKDIQSKFSDIKSIPVQMPVGIESDFKAVIDLVGFKMLKLEGEDGGKVVVNDILPEHKDEAMKRRNEMIVSVADISDEIANLYLEEKPIGADVLRMAIRKLVKTNKMCPIFCGSAKKNIGIHPVLDAIACYLPSPEDFPVQKAFNIKNDEPIEIRY